MYSKIVVIKYVNYNLPYYTSRAIMKYAESKLRQATLTTVRTLLGEELLNGKKNGGPLKHTPLRMHQRRSHHRDFLQSPSSAWMTLSFQPMSEDFGCISNVHTDDWTARCPQHLCRWTMTTFFAGEAAKIYLQIHAVASHHSSHSY